MLFAVEGGLMAQNSLALASGVPRWNTYYDAVDRFV